MAGVLHLKLGAGLKEFKRLLRRVHDLKPIRHFHP
jgi:hypothetical protein